MQMNSQTKRIVVCLLVATLILSISSYATKEVKKYAVHDKTRKNPKVITPPERVGQPPSDAIVLFDGTNTLEWVSERKGGGDVPWKIENDYMEVVKKRRRNSHEENIWELPVAC